MDRTYLKKVNLKGYRTIKDLDAEFNPGLNLIIGKNGTGKTNFLTLLDGSLKFNLKDFFEAESVLWFDGKSDIRLELASKNYLTGDSSNDFGYFDDLPTNIKVQYENELMDYNSSDEFKNSSYYSLVRTINPILVPHGLRPDNVNKIISSSASFKTKRNSIPDLIGIRRRDDTSYFLKSFNAGFSHLLLSAFYNREVDWNNPNQYYLETIIQSYFEIVSDILNKSISQYLPLKAVRISPSVKIYPDNSDGSIEIKDILMEFQIEDSWLPFSSLSDGTKRMFCIYADVIFPWNSGDDLSKANKIILLEEPELGVHPHQFEQIMTFLKEMSKDVQIILTTHSPQALDILGRDELDALHICEYTPETGTTLTRLDKDQTGKAKAYMESDMYLSDYWRYSDLEK